ncbi:hypothetical protein MMC15_007299 [Xylographa vitiligo]|nr:hypothetical protein [Xylographa vitiligo]
MYMTFAIASAILAGTAIASQDFARRDAYPDAEALISQNAHLYARDAYASAYEDAYYELSARWAEPELYLDEPDFDARDLDDHYFDERDETEEQRRAREAEEQRQRLATAKRLAEMVPQTPVPNNVIGGLQTVAKGIINTPGQQPKPYIVRPNPAPMPNPSDPKYPITAGLFGGGGGQKKKGGKR